MKKEVIFMPFAHGVFVGETGEYVKSVVMSQTLNPARNHQDEFRKEVASLLHVPLLTTGFLHCKNVQRVDVTATEGPAPGRCS